MLENLTAINAENVTASNSTVYNPPFKGLLLVPTGADKTVTIKNEKNASVLITIAAANVNAFFVPGRVRQVMATGTDLPNANIIGVR